MIAGLAPLLAAVQRNCHIADARHAREMTLCTYLLEMREFYRWENELPPGAPLPRADIGNWITEREALWESVADQEFTPLPLAGAQHDPFAAIAMNEALLPQGLVYGAGIGRFGKPHFFLGRLARREDHDGLDVLVCDCEYARDLTAIPAAMQSGTVIVRREALGQWLWEKAEAWGMKRKAGAMARALAAYDYDADPAAALARMTERETETLILHERGEHAAGRLLGPEWKEMIAGFTTRRAEIVARAVRDNLADCLVTLPALLVQPDDASLNFWFANFDGLRRELFPRLAAAYETGKVSRGDTPLREAVAAGADHWRDVALRLLAQDETCIAEFVATPAPIAL
ncbi:MAG: hypothetical protein KJ634_03345 [Gammaproteobacteria bacterium]|nr:hypothetical protein [Gammaproteobacteria bacterium]MBU1414638.1 hypothetical protein [Gammaproteobacteria bacterium]